jgi:hypothetical protein
MTPGSAKYIVRLLKHFVELDLADDRMVEIVRQGVQQLPPSLIVSRVIAKFLYTVVVLIEHKTLPEYAIEMLKSIDFP